MKYLPRGAAILLLLALSIGVMALSAQDNDTISAGGSGIVLPLLEALGGASESPVQISTTVTGTTSGIAQFCQGSLDMVATNRPISIEEDTNCTTNGVRYTELLIGHDIIAFVTNPDVDFVQCLTSDDLDVILEPSAGGQITNWNQVNPDNPDAALAVILPADNTPTYAILDQLVKGVGLRSDAAMKDTSQAVVTTVSESPGAFGVVNLAAAGVGADSIQILELDSGDGTCVSPSVENVEGRRYSGATRLFLYVNQASLDKSGLKDLLAFITSDDTAAIVADAGFTPPSSAVYETNRTALEDSSAGRLFSQEVVTFEIPETLTGQVSIGGAEHLYSYLQRVINTFTGTYANTTVDYRVEGELAGFRRLCNGEFDLVSAYNEMSSDQAANCEANEIATLSVDMGYQPAVLVANAAADFLSCLTTEQLTAAWSAESADTIKQWNEVDSSFPETSMTLFAPREGDTYTDLILTAAAGTDITARTDIEINSNALYRAAATANVEGALTYMSWPDYQRVLANNQANIQLVAVDGGDGCVTPSEETITNGSYPLSRHGLFVISKPSLARVEVQSLLWYLFSDNNYSTLESSGFVGVKFADLPKLREMLQREFVQAEADAQARAASPELTPEATVEPETEATQEATAEAEAEAKPEATADTDA